MVDSEPKTNAEIIEKGMKWAFNRGLIWGAIFGALLALPLGYAIAYHTIDRTVIIPLGEGQKA